MKKVSRSPTLEWRADNNTHVRSAEGRSGGVRALPYDLKKSILPRSIDLMFTLKYRR